MRATAVVALLLHALPRAHGAATTFVRVPEALAYAEAEARCTQIGAAIASIHSAAENALARTACGNNTCWLGLVDGRILGTDPAAWLWQDPPAGQAADPAYTNWAAGEPDNNGALDRRNAIIDTAGEWHDSGATLSRGRRAQFHPRTHPARVLCQHGMLRRGHRHSQ